MLNKSLSFWIVILAGFISIIPMRTLAHEVRPAFLQIKQTGNNEYEVLWKIPRSGEMVPAISPRFPSWFKTENVNHGELAGSGALFQFKAFSTKDIHGMNISIDGLIESSIEVLVYIEFLHGEKYSLLLQPNKSSASIPNDSSYITSIKTYFALGVEHILLGTDHLLFVLALLLITRGTRKLIATVTAFTIAHSITLSLSVLGFVGLPAPPVEAVIALSILFLALELVRHYQGKMVMSARYPWIVAFVFGLLHGFGFAGALASIGLPQKGVPLALAFFNVGVETGQLVFIAIVLIIMFCIKKLKILKSTWQKYIPPYFIGGVAAFWVIERIWLMAY